MFVTLFVLATNLNHVKYQSRKINYGICIYWNITIREKIEWTRILCIHIGEFHKYNIVG